MSRAKFILDLLRKDGRGSQFPANKTSIESEQKIIDHINSFPRVESRYCRKKSKKQYLDSKLTIAKMYELHKEQLIADNQQPCSFYVYKKVFEVLQDEYDLHIARKDAAQKAKELNNQRSINDDNYLVVTTDMQSTLHILVQQNAVYFGFFVHLIQRSDTQFDVIEQKYLESGHTHMEVDSMHSAIERQQRHTPVYSMIDWKSTIVNVRSKRHRDSAPPPYIVKELNYSDIFDVFEYQTKTLVTKKRRKQEEEINTPERKELEQNLKNYVITKAYSSPLPISEAKKKDLLNVCTKGIIP
ncbi:hypothetical protein ACJJTC_014285 [Scirpophaga incertulas]